METAISQLSTLPETKAQRVRFVEMVKDELLSGVYNPLQFEVRLKNTEEVIKSIRADRDIKDLVYNEACKYPEKTFEAHGAKITKVNRTTWNYKGCGDSVYDSLIAESEKLKEKIAERETFLKSLKPDMQIADGTNGNMITPPTCMVTESLTITIQ